MEEGRASVNIGMRGPRVWARNCGRGRFCDDILRCLNCLDGDGDGPCCLTGLLGSGLDEMLLIVEAECDERKRSLRNTRKSMLSPGPGAIRVSRLNSLAQCVQLKLR